MTRERGDWLILRTSGGRTIALAKSLQDVGIEAWTPITRVSKRRPRSKLRIEHDAPIAPTFVFVRKEHVGYLRDVLNLPVSPHPPFSIFKFANRYPCVADADIIGFREEQERQTLRAARRSQRTYEPGKGVRVLSGSFQGMSGIVESAKGKFVLVAFQGSFRAKIGSWLLCDDTVSREQSSLDAAA